MELNKALRITSDGAKQALFSDLVDSYRLAMESEGLPTRTIDVVSVTVSDYVNNHWF